MGLTYIDWIIMLLYFASVLGIGAVLKRHVKTSTDFFLAGRSIPAWIAGLAFLSANLGAQEVIGMAASGAKYGIMTAHFYWVGAVPAMIFVGVFSSCWRICVTFGVCAASPAKSNWMGTKMPSVLELSMCCLHSPLLK